MKNPIFTGAGVAIITPFTADGKVNEKVLAEIIEYQISHSTDAIVICGTTGESATLDHNEHTQAIKIAVDVTAGRIPVIAGTGSNDTAYALKLSNDAEKLGVDGLLMVTPYYNKASQEGLIKHFSYVADRVSTPIILYNVPSRTGCEIKPETYAELAKHKMIYAAKEATGNLSSIAKTISLVPEDFAIYSGNDDQITPIMSLGGKGVISVLSNILPQVAHDIAQTALDGDFKKSAELQLKYLELCNAMFMDVNPIPVKVAMRMMGFTATKPLFVPRRLRCEGIISICSGLSSGRTIGTSGVCLCALLFETTGHSAFAYSSSRALISSFFISTAQKTKSTCDAISFISSVAFITTRSLTFSGIATSMHHFEPTASSYFLPAERALAATTFTLNHG